MKILHLSTEPGFRGGERQLLRVHEGLRSSGIESVILCSRRNRDLSEVPESFSLNLSGIAAFTSIFQVKKLLKQIQPDLIHCHDSRSLSLAAMLKQSRPLVFSRKTAYPLKKSRSSRMKFQSLTAVVAVSEASARSVYSSYPCLPVRIIHDGVTWESGISRDEVRKKFNVADEQFLFAAVGHFTSEKNLPLLLKTADLLSEQYRHARILLIGPVIKEVQEIVNSHPAIIAPGRVENAEQYYAGFDCYLSSSTREGLGSALLDAVVRDIPAVALDSGGSREIFGEDDIDHCSSPEQFFQRISAHIDHDISQEQTLLRGQRARELFSVEQLGNNHIRLYEDILSGRI